MPRKLRDFKSKVLRKKALPNFGKKFSTSILLFDQTLIGIPGFTPWSERFALALPLKAGEDLKSLSSVENIVTQMLSLRDEVAVERIVVLGGGSLGDFAGFIASIWKRGVELIQIPSTWLAAMDSAHGGKTALNVGSYKNQIGTFWPAAEVYLVEEILLRQPPERAEEAFGEAMKMALIFGGRLWKNLAATKRVSNQILWSVLPDVIQAKYQIVLKDPFETKQLRHILNLGHTLGHVWEITQKIPHGRAVAAGLRVSVEISRKRKWISESDYKKIVEAPGFALLPSWGQIRSWTGTTEELISFIAKDKKRKAGLVNYIGLKKVGRPCLKPLQIHQLALLAHQVIYAQ